MNYGALAQSGERLRGTQEVSGSSPLCSIGTKAVTRLLGFTAFFSDSYSTC